MGNYIFSTHTEMLDVNCDALIIFKAAWCGHCVRFVPELEKLKHILKKAPLQIRAIDEQEFSKERAADPVVNAAHTYFGGFPTIVYYHSALKTYSVYNGDRRAEVLGPILAKTAGFKLPKKTTRKQGGGGCGCNKAPSQAGGNKKTGGMLRSNTLPLDSYNKKG